MPTRIKVARYGFCTGKTACTCGTARGTVVVGVAQCSRRRRARSSPLWERFTSEHCVISCIDHMHLLALLYAREPPKTPYSELQVFPLRTRTGGRMVLIRGGSDNGSVRPLPHLQTIFPVTSYTSLPLLSLRQRQQTSGVF